MIKADTKVNELVDDLSPLMTAALHNNTEAITLLVEHEACVDCPNSKDETSLLLACRHQKWESARLLIDSGEDVFHAVGQEETPFLAVMRDGDGELISHMASKSQGVLQILQNTPFEDLCMLGYNGTWLDNFNNLPEHELESLVEVASEYGNVEVLKKVALQLQNQTIVNCITEAYSAGHYDCVEELVKCCRGRAEIPRPDIALHEICKHRELIDLTRFLVENGADVNEGNGEPLRVAAKYGNVKAVAYLLEKDTPIDAADAQGRTPLIYACEENHW
jgi:ankyrin repeat protein